MSKSKARKLRDRMIREGKRNPSDNRGIYALADLRTRKTKTKQQKKMQNKHKGRLSGYGQADNRPLFYLILSTRTKRPSGIRPKTSYAMERKAEKSNSRMQFACKKREHDTAGFRLFPVQGYSHIEIFTIIGT